MDSPGDGGFTVDSSDRDPIDDENMGDDDVYVMDHNADYSSMCDVDLEPQSRGRANTWHGIHLDGALPPHFQGNALGNSTPSSSGPVSGTPSASKESLVGMKKSASGGRRNAWGNFSYSELITQAIERSPEGRLTLAQIYDWMIKNVPYFSERSDAGNSGGWKNSIRHNLSLHSRFQRLSHEGAGKSSPWVLNYDAISSQGKSSMVTAGPRRRANTLDSKLYDKKRLAAAARGKVRMRGHIRPDLSAAGSPGEVIGNTLFRAAGAIGSNASSVHRLSPAIDAINEEHDDLASLNWDSGAARANASVDNWLGDLSQWDGCVNHLGDSLNATNLASESSLMPDVDMEDAATMGLGNVKLRCSSSSAVKSEYIARERENMFAASGDVLCGLLSPGLADSGLWSGASKLKLESESMRGSQDKSMEQNMLQSMVNRGMSQGMPEAKSQHQQLIGNPQLMDMVQKLINQGQLAPESTSSRQDQQGRQIQVSESQQQQQQQERSVRQPRPLSNSEYLKIITLPEFWSSGSPKLLSKVRELLMAKKSEMLAAEQQKRNSVSLSASAPVTPFQPQMQQGRLFEQSILPPSSDYTVVDQSAACSENFSVAESRAITLPSSASSSGLEHSMMSLMKSREAHLEDVVDVITDDLGCDPSDFDFTLGSPSSQACTVSFEDEVRKI